MPCHRIIECVRKKWKHSQMNGIWECGRTRDRTGQGSRIWEKRCLWSPFSIYNLWHCIWIYHFFFVHCVIVWCVCFSAAVYLSYFAWVFADLNCWSVLHISIAEQRCVRLDSRATRHHIVLVFLGIPGNANTRRHSVTMPRRQIRFCAWHSIFGLLFIIDTVYSAEM